MPGRGIFLERGLKRRPACGESPIHVIAHLITLATDGRAQPRTHGLTVRGNFAHAFSDNARL